jgi:Protein of unknown function (DUF3455)
MICTTSKHPRPSFTLLAACAVALAVTGPGAWPSLAHADHITVPAVPSNIQAPAGKAFFEGHAVGTQNYICLPLGSGFIWTLFGPQATLFNDKTQQITTHFLSANPDEGGLARATWQHSRDTSSIWAMAIATTSDPAFVAPGAIPWLLLQVVGAQDGPTGGDKLSETTFVQRLNTAGGVAPGTGCVQAIDVGRRALVPYTADYFFYKAAKQHANDTTDEDSVRSPSRNRLDKTP